MFRLAQLDAAIQMELWQEAYKAVEDIHGLMSLSKKTFPPKMMANYYQKLALVFWKSGNHLFHAAAVFKHFQLTREMKKSISGEELSRSDPVVNCTVDYNIDCQDGLESCWSMFVCSSPESAPGV